MRRPEGKRPSRPPRGLRLAAASVAVSASSWHRRLTILPHCHFCRPSGLRRCGCQGGRSAVQRQRQRE